MFADWKRTEKFHIQYHVRMCLCVHTGVCVCVCTWTRVMCVCTCGWLDVSHTIPVTPVSTSINTHVKSCIASLYIEWSPLAATPPPPPPTAGTQLTHRTSSCACHPTLSPRAFRLAKRSKLEQASRELWVRATRGGGGWGGG